MAGTICQEVPVIRLRPMMAAAQVPPRTLKAGKFLLTRHHSNTLAGRPRAVAARCRPGCPGLSLRGGGHDRPTHRPCDPPVLPAVGARAWRDGGGHSDLCP